jgi:small subunit ribosomal protein S16
MPVKLRLARHGKKGYAYYHIVVADSRSPRDGKFIEQIGSYNPNTNPATINLRSDKALDWLAKGAQPTDTVRAILSEKGVLYKKHLMGGVKKGAFTAEEAEARFAKWLSDKESQIRTKQTKLADAKGAAAKARLADESKVKEARAKATAAKKAEAAAAAAPQQEEAADQEVAAIDDVIAEKQEPTHDLTVDAGAEPSAAAEAAEAAAEVVTEAAAGE